MIEKCRELCRKYTNLSEAEVDCIIGYLDRLQEIADRRRSNVYIDCLTHHPQSAIIIHETFPTTVKPLYSSSLVGKVIKTYNEPAVERGFSLGIPTEGVATIKVPEITGVIQSVYPIVYEGKVIANIILEMKTEEYKAAQLKKYEDSFKDLNLVYLLEQLPEAVFVVDRQGDIVYCNSMAAKLFIRLGYVDSVVGMKSENVIVSLEQDICQFQMSGRMLETKKFRLMQNNPWIGVMIRDITEKEELKRSRGLIQTEYRELIHSMKNSLFLLKGICEQKKEHSEKAEVSHAYEEMSDLVSSLVMIMELKLDCGEKRLDIRKVLWELAEGIVGLNSEESQGITVEVIGDEIEFSSGEINAIVVVVYELLCNALKYAFPEHKDGCHIKIQVERDDFFSQIKVSDNGCGFDPGTAYTKSNGFKLIRTIIRERLNGRLVIHSSEKGTIVSFDIC